MDYNFLVINVDGKGNYGHVIKDCEDAGHAANILTEACYTYTNYEEGNEEFEEFKAKEEYDYDDIMAFDMRFGETRVDCEGFFLGDRDVAAFIVFLKELLEVEKHKEYLDKVGAIAEKLKENKNVSVELDELNSVLWSAQNA